MRRRSASASPALSGRSAAGSTNTGSRRSASPARSSSAPAITGAAVVRTARTRANAARRRRCTLPALPAGSRSRASEVAAPRLLPLDRLEEGLEVAGAEALRALPLDDLEEHGRTVADVLGEQLEQVAVLVLVDEDTQLLQLVPRQLEVPEPLSYVRIVRIGDLEEPHTALAHRRHGRGDVVGAQRDVLDARAAVEVDVLLDLALLAAVGRFVDGQHDLRAVPHHC